MWDYCGGEDFQRSWSLTGLQAALLVTYLATLLRASCKEAKATDDGGSHCPLVVSTRHLTSLVVPVKGSDRRSCSVRGPRCGLVGVVDRKPLCFQKSNIMHSAIRLPLWPIQPLRVSCPPNVSRNEARCGSSQASQPVGTPITASSGSFPSMSLC